MHPLPSSTGDATGFSKRIPWILTWTIALSFFLAGLVCAESAWHSLGYRPSAVDSPALWKYWYERAATGRPKTIVLIGASRIQAGVSTRRMRERLPDYEVVQLGRYAGHSPVGVLRALAMDQRFNGIVICDILAPFLIRERWRSQRDVYEASVTTREQLEAYETAQAGDLLAINNASTGIGAALVGLMDQSRFPSPNHVRLRADRSLEIDFAVMEDLQEFRKKNASVFRDRYEQSDRPSPEGLDDEVQEIDGFVRDIQDRGGQVVFVRMPSSGERAKMEDIYHPKAKYWDRFAATSSGICIHWTEIAGAGNFTCPDDSHLDYRDAITFTNLLVDVLAQRGLFVPR